MLLFTFGLSEAILDGSILVYCEWLDVVIPEAEGFVYWVGLELGLGSSLTTGLYLLGS